MTILPGFYLIDPLRTLVDYNVLTPGVGLLIAGPVFLEALLVLLTEQAEYSSVCCATARPPCRWKQPAC